MIDDAEIRARVSRRLRVDELGELDALRDADRPRRSCGDAETGRGNAVPAREPEVPLIVLSASARGLF